MTFLRDLHGLFQRFRHGTRAVAAVEFALILPLMMVLYMGTIEISQIITVDRKMSAMAGSLGDLVAQSNNKITTAQLNDYFQAVGLIMAPYPTANLKQLVTLVYVDSNGDTSVSWSVGYNGATAKTTGTSYPLPSQITDISRDMYVVVSETQLAYQPWGGYVFSGSFNLYKQYFHLPRFGAKINLI